MRSSVTHLDAISWPLNWTGSSLSGIWLISASGMCLHIDCLRKQGIPQRHKPDIVWFTSCRLFRENTQGAIKLFTPQPEPSLKSLNPRTTRRPVFYFPHCQLILITMSLQQRTSRSQPPMKCRREH